MTDKYLFYSANLENIDLTTHSSNANGTMFKMLDDTEVGPFNSINGLKTFEFADEAAIFWVGLSPSSPHEDKRTLNVNEFMVLMIANKNTRERFDYPDAQWSSSNPDVVELISKTGSDISVKAISHGNSVITATDAKGNKIRFTITVLGTSFADDARILIKGVDEVKDSHTVVVSSRPFLSIGKSSNLKDYYYPFTKWRSSNPDVVEILFNSEDTDVFIEALKVGSSRITATDERGNSLVLVINVLERADIGDFYYSDYTYSTDRDKSKTVIGIVFETDGTNGKVISLDQTYCEWNNDKNSKKIDSDYSNGLINMYKVFSQNDQNDYTAFMWVHNKNKGATKDTYTENAKNIWYLPARAELNNDFRWDKITDKINSSMIAANGTLLYDTTVLWSSTYVTVKDYVWAVPINGWLPMETDKTTDSNHVRAILAF